MATESGNQRSSGLVNPFAMQGEWFRGNLHTHTTASDGELTPDAAAELYAQHGYDFLAISDHNVVVDPEDVDGHGMVLLPAAEYGAPGAGLGQGYHLLAVGMTRTPEVDGTAQDRIEALKQAGAMVFVAHPYWSSLTVSDLLAIEGYDGVEVYNWTCQGGVGRGHSEPHLDGVLAYRRDVRAIAVDDAHLHYWDAIGGWIMVKAAELSREAILQAIRMGAFYASSGPEIRDVAVAGDTVHVECSPAVSVALVVAGPGRGWTSDRWGWRRDGKVVTEADLPLDAVGNYAFRIEVLDERGNRAWTNPMSLS